MSATLLSPPPETTRTPLRRRGWVTAALVIAVLAFLGWIAVLAVTLPTQYVASHWNVAWAGFDAMLLAGLLSTGWAVVRRRPWAPSAAMVSAALLVCDAWFDMATASGATAMLFSAVLAGAVELPAAACLAWWAVRGHAGRTRRKECPT